MRLLLIRHPAPLAAPHTCYGASDIDADPTALADAVTALQPLLRDESGPVRSSPLRRCTALAVPLAARLRAPPPLLDARLAEMDFGDWELRPWDSIPRREIDAWAADPVGYAPGGGETVLQVAARIADFLTGFHRKNKGYWALPVGIISDSKGHLYVSSDRITPAIFRIEYDPED